MRSVGFALLVSVVACGAASSTTTSPDAPNAPGGTDAPSPVPSGTSSASGSSAGGTSSSSSSGAPAPGTNGRDWKTYPAIVDLPAPATLFAVSDVHGGYDRLTALLLANGLIAHAPTTPADAHWAAGAAVLVVAGDMIDKGPSSVEVLDFLMALQTDATAAGGRVVVTLGNHEAEFLVDPSNTKASKSDGIDPELSADGVAPSSVASGTDPRGAWLRRLPFGARVGGWFFSHAGDTGGRTIAALESALEGAVTAHPDYDDPEIVGATSILESQDWYTGSTPAQNAAALGVKHIVFGHDPHALGTEGHIARGSGGLVLRIDCGMSPDVDYSTGMLLRVTQDGANDDVDELDASGSAERLFTSAR